MIVAFGKSPQTIAFLQSFHPHFNYFSVGVFWMRANFNTTVAFEDYEYTKKATEYQYRDLYFYDQNISFATNSCTAKDHICDTIFRLPITLIAFRRTLIACSILHKVSLSTLIAFVFAWDNLRKRALYYWTIIIFSQNCWSRTLIFCLKNLNYRINLLRDRLRLILSNSNDCWIVFQGPDLERIACPFP